MSDEGAVAVAAADAWVLVALVGDGVDVDTVVAGAAGQVMAVRRVLYALYLFRALHLWENTLALGQIENCPFGFGETDGSY